ncbi:hypothetical protein H1C71_028677, partial [Ictidomys tridecemlineatus]
MGRLSPLPKSSRILRPPWGPFLLASFHILWIFRASPPPPHLIPSHPSQPSVSSPTYTPIEPAAPPRAPRPGICTPSIQQARYLLHTSVPAGSPSLPALHTGNFR